ncbi:MAG: phosphatidylserine decarboxylase [Sandaracinaceae bacterium]|nr:phosphatidylserine decarboxylase [Sandaracinaceae bacterium]
MPLSKTRVAAELLRILPRKRVSQALGMLADLPVPTSVLDQLTGVYIKAYNVDLSEAEVPEGGFASFNSFFTRRLHPGSRPLDQDATALLSPADGRIEDCGPIERGATFRVKGKLYDVGELLGDSSIAHRYDGGLFSIVYLSPRDYHRVHAPVAGKVSEARYVGGTLYPVNAIGAHVPRLFARNERVVVHQNSLLHGDVVSILVGAVGVGRIGIAFDEELVTNVGKAPVVHTYGDDGPYIDRGDELGVFYLGSTVILLTEARAKWKLVTAAGDSVRMGQALARKVAV